MKLHVTKFVIFVAMVSCAGKQIECSFYKMVLRGVYSVVIPTRFLTLLAHFFILVCLLWDKVSSQC